MLRCRSLAIAFTLALSILAVATSAALAAGALNITAPDQLRPAMNQQLPQGQAVQFHIVTDCINQPMYAVVSNQSTTEADGSGTLAAIGIQDQVAMEAARDGTYTGSTSGAWTNAPGTYFWQAQINGDCGGLGKQVWASEVIPITVVPTATPSGSVDVTADDNGEILTEAQARAAVRDGILKLTRKVPRGLTRRCSRRTSGSLVAVFCTTSWHDKKKYAYNGSWRMALNDDGTIEARFDGRRAPLRCLRKATQRSRCFKKWPPARRRTIVIG